MIYKTVWSVFFSATGTTQKIVTEIAAETAKTLNLPHKSFDFTLPDARKEALCFTKDDLVVFGTPVIAGRVPNLLLKYLDTLSGGGAAAIPVVLYGNRNFDDALIELRDILEKTGFHTVAAAAFIGEHSFSETLAKGRPDEADIALVHGFAGKVVEKINALSTYGDKSVDVDGVPFPYRGYYQPRDRHENHIDIRKVKPLTSAECDNCLLCVKICPMGSIDLNNAAEIPGICMKCCACIKKCPKKAKYFDDAGYLYHKGELEDIYKRRAEPQVFL
jgi:ferredoxin/flavodoxin